jgi:prophage antirepressor-like protein
VKFPILGVSGGLGNMRQLIPSVLCLHELWHFEPPDLKSLEQGKLIMSESNSLTFKNHTLTLQDNRWITAKDIAEILYSSKEVTAKGVPLKGYPLGSNSLLKLRKLYSNHKKEFRPSMVNDKIKIATKGGKQETLCFSLRGIHLLCMFCTTPIAAEFREWALDVLENHVDEQKPVSVATPAPEEQPMIEKTVITQEDVTNEFRMACNYLLPVMDNFRAYKELWETRTILIHSAPRQALALNDALGGLYERILEDVQSSYTTMRDMITGKKLKAKPNTDISIHHVLERMSQKTK